MQQKVNDVLGSQNFLTTLITLALFILQYNGAPIVDPEGLTGDLYEAIKSGNLFAIVTIALPNIINPIIKIAKNKFDAGFLKSVNFWVQFGTVILMALAGLGLQFPEGAAAELVSAIFGGEFNVIGIAVFINIINPIYHFFKNKKGKEDNITVTELPLAFSPAMPRAKFYNVPMNKIGQHYATMIKDKNLFDKSNPNSFDAGQRYGAIRTIRLLFKSIDMNQQVHQLVNEDIKKLNW